jgi:ribosome biogenesis GTPase A
MRDGDDSDSDASGSDSDDHDDDDAVVDDDNNLDVGSTAATTTAAAATSSGSRSKAALRQARAPGWLKSQFARESDSEVHDSNNDSVRPFLFANRREPWSVVLSVPLDDGAIDLPKRPYPIRASAEQLEREQNMYDRWLGSIERSYDPSTVNLFELNLEVWRQLWRALERSHMCALVVDARFPHFHFPPALYRYCLSFKKPVILILNKTDLVPEEIVDQWEAWFNARYPGLRLVRFASFQSSSDALDTTRKRRLKKGMRHYDGGDGRRQFLSLVRELAPSAPAPVYEFTDGKDHRKNPKKDSIHVAIVGNPNVGKSSFINGVVRRKVVSVSATPGHTKYYQTIELEDSPDDTDVKAKGIVLVDSPGLVFPTVDRSRAVQVLCGLYPIALLRTPYPMIRVVGESLPLEKLYHLQPPNDEDDDTDYTVNRDAPTEPPPIMPPIVVPRSSSTGGGSGEATPLSPRDSLALTVTSAAAGGGEASSESDASADDDGGARPIDEDVVEGDEGAEPAYKWSPYAVCAALAKQRGYMMERSGRPDARRAALEILKDCRDGRVVLFWPPPKIVSSRKSNAAASSAAVSSAGDDLAGALDKLQLSDSSDSSDSNDDDILRGGAVSSSSQHAHEQHRHAVADDGTPVATRRAEKLHKSGSNKPSKGKKKTSSGSSSRKGGSALIASDQLPVRKSRTKSAPATNKNDDNDSTDSADVNEESDDAEQAIDSGSSAPIEASSRRRGVQGRGGGAMAEYYRRMKPQSALEFSADEDDDSKVRGSRGSSDDEDDSASPATKGAARSTGATGSSTLRPTAKRVEDEDSAEQAEIVS